MHFLNLSNLVPTLQLELKSILSFAYLCFDTWCYIDLKVFNVILSYGMNLYFNSKGF